MLEPIINQTYTINGKTVKCVEVIGVVCDNCIIADSGKIIPPGCMNIVCESSERKDGKDIILEIV